MMTPMEKVAEDIVLTALTIADKETLPPKLNAKLTEDFRAIWPWPDSPQPINSAMKAAAQAANTSTGQDQDAWLTRLNQLRQPATKEVMHKYLKDARKDFRNGEHLKGAETLAGVPRAALGEIAARRNWPHRNDGDLYTIIVSMDNGAGWLHTREDFQQALDRCTEQTMDLTSALGASTGLPESIRFGSYAYDMRSVEADGVAFAQTVIELSKRLAEEAPVNV